MQGPYGQLHIYEVKGHLQHIPPSWRSQGFLGCWGEGDYSFLFFARPRREMVETYLALHPEIAGLRSVTEIPYEDWEAGAPLEAFRVGRLWVAPPWQEVELGDGEVLLLIDPGVTFGSGQHGSTRTALELLVHLYQSSCPRQALDLGTGSGILALAAASLGAQRVLAVDLQPLCVETARANVSRNGLVGRVEVRLGDAIDWAGVPADLVMANLTYEVLCALLDHGVLLGQSHYIFSGLVGRQVHRFEERLASFGLRVKEVRSQNLWFSLLVQREG